MKNDRVGHIYKDVIYYYKGMSVVFFFEKKETLKNIRRGN
jgi:hypothetical protein